METLIYVTIAYIPKMMSWLQMATRSSFMRGSVFLLRPDQGEQTVKTEIHCACIHLWMTEEGVGESRVFKGCS